MRHINLVDDEKTYITIENKKVRCHIIDIIKKSIKIKEINYWMYATLANCYFVLHDETKYTNYEKLFLNNCNTQWEKDTYFETLSDIKALV